ncbi:HlyD family type I secretion periplasmic adaptor subunit [uncultured Sulfitobacter sp.]|uniref:HlyD family type I secretion periplasmic adaptor subunit n=1 Tax=uncultured Sulfitobacter sp. TaxID=191468 RepID=UPI0026104DC3|nr:HlyD family type I secretion periplasmic adaptor subunit [uncultured Sulfitobacter sp.]
MTLAEIKPTQVALEKSGFLDRMPDAKLPTKPPTRVRSLVFWMAFCGFGLFGGLLFWASTAQMTSAVVSNGQFKVLGDRLVVQHFEGGIVEEINVVEGETVEEGQILAVLNGTRTEAQLGILTNQLASALAQHSRLQAELLEADEIVPSQELLELIERDARLSALLDAQKAVFETNNDLENGQVEILKSRMTQLNEQLSGQDKRRAAFQTQLDLLQEDRAALDDLYQQGLVTKTRLSNTLQRESRLIGDLAQLDSQREGTLVRASEMQERMLQIRRDRLRRNSDERQGVEERIFDLRQRLDAVDDVQARQTIRAPRAGRVVNLSINTLGAVIDSGDPLLEIVPLDGDLVLETQIALSDIDEVKQGGEAVVRLTAYSFRSTPPVTGTVTHVAADATVDPATGRPFYRVDITVPPEQIAALQNVEALPGMPAQAMIETGEQTLMDYMLNPLLGSMATAMKEGDS